MYLDTVYDLAPGDFLIIQHKMQPQLYGYGVWWGGSNTPLSGSNNSHGDWFYDNNSMLFSYISMCICLITSSFLATICV
jgi:hypothetical protein